MPEFTTISVTEAKLRTTAGRQKTFLAEYVTYIQQLPKGQAGKLTLGEQEKHQTVRRRLLSAAKAMNIPLLIKRSGTDLYFWQEDTGAEQHRTKRSYTRRTRTDGEIPTPDQSFSMSEEVNHEPTVVEESPELGQTSA